MAWYDYVINAGASIVPSHDANPETQMRWRWSVAGLLLVITLSQTAHILIACGWLASIGLPGFAYASDLASLSAAQSRTEIRLIETNLMAMEVAHCKALASQKPTRYIVEMIRDNMKDYKAISGQDWLRPLCTEIGE